MRVRLSGCAATLTLGALLAGCVGSGEGSDMDMQAAAEHADAIMEATLAGIKPAVHWAHGPTTTGSCDVTRRRSVMTIVSESRRGNFLGGWSSESGRTGGYRIKGGQQRSGLAGDLRPDQRRVWGVSLIFGGGGQAFFEVDSPCVEESEVAESTTPPTAPPTTGGSTRCPAPTSVTTSGPPARRERRPCAPVTRTHRRKRPPETRPRWGMVDGCVDSGWP